MSSLHNYKKMAIKMSLTLNEDPGKGGWSQRGGGQEGTQEGDNSGK